MKAKATHSRDHTKEDLKAKIQPKIIIKAKLSAIGKMTIYYHLK